MTVYAISIKQYIIITTLFTTIHKGLRCLIDLSVYLRLCYLNNIIIYDTIRRIRSLKSLLP